MQPQTTSRHFPTEAMPKFTRSNVRPAPGEVVLWSFDNCGGEAVVIGHVGAYDGQPVIECTDVRTRQTWTLHPHEYSLAESETDACRFDTRAHINRVRERLDQFCKEMGRRGYVHDRSKLHEPELSVFAEVTPKLKGLTYGSDEYFEQLAALKPALDHHYAANDHHPQHFGDPDEVDVVAEMDLFQLVEMFCDWVAAAERHDDGDVRRSIEVNEGRFKLSPQLAQVLRNTADRWPEPHATRQPLPGYGSRR